jgi:hypothetical protein
MRPAQLTQAAGPADTEAPRSTMPSTGRQKTFIVENSKFLNRESARAIMSIVMMEVGASVVAETRRGHEVELDVDLDAVADVNEEVIGHIYNIVRARLATLSHPACAARGGTGASAGPAGPGPRH